MINLNRDGDMIRLSHLPADLAGIGVEVPDALRQAIEANAWHAPDPMVEVEAAKADLRAATTRDEWIKAEERFAKALTLGQVRHLPEFQSFLTAERHTRQTAAVHAVADGLVSAVAERFTDPAGRFVEAFAAVPGASDLDPFEMPPAVAVALSAARESADEMTEIVGVYKAVLRLAGRDVPSVVDLIGEDYDDRNRAAELIEFYATRGHATDDGQTPVVPVFRRLAPFVAVPLAGGSLRLAVSG
jgi:hypothetical protein